MGAKKTDSQELIRRQLGYVLLKSKRKDSEILEVYISSVQSLSRVRLFATPWITAHQAYLSITNSRSSLKLTSMERFIY